MSKKNDGQNVEPVTVDEVKKHNTVLTPGRYVGIPAEDDDSIPFDEKIAALTTDLRDQMQEAGELDMEIKKQLAKIGVDL